MSEGFPSDIPDRDDDWQSEQQFAGIPEHESLFIREPAETADIPDGPYEELPETQDMGRLFEHIDDAQREAFVAFIAAVDEAHNEEANPVAMFVAITSEQGILSFRHAIDAHDFAPTLTYAGLRYKTTGLLPELVICDGKRFSEALTNIHTAAPVIQQGTERAVDSSLKDVAAGFVPSVDEESYWTFHTNPQPLPQLSDSVFAKPYQAQKQQLFEYANTIAVNMAALDMDPYLYDELIAARDAETQGMLGEWAVARHWGLYQPPTLRDNDRRWTAWRDERDWKALFDFIDHIVEKAGADSPFVQHLAARAAENITSKRLGILAPAIPSPTDIPGVAGFNVNEQVLEGPKAPIHTTLDRLAEEFRYDNQLLAAEDRLRRLVH